MAQITRQDVEQLIAASERIQSDEWEAFGSSDDDLYTIESPHGRIASYVDLDSSDFIAQSRNLTPQLARDWLQKDAENRRMREALEKISTTTDEVYGVEFASASSIIARRALAGIDVGSGGAVNE